jgi:hypothetical protein
MKICICCNTEADDSAITCANCGEGSWSRSSIVAVRSNEPKPESFAIIPSPETAPTIANEEMQPVAISDPETAPDIPARRRRNR